MKKTANIQTGAEYIYCALNENGNRFQRRVTVVEVFDDEVAKVRFEEGYTRNVYTSFLHEIGSDGLKQMLINEARFMLQIEWPEMTEYNQHSEVRQVIAMHFGYDAYAGYFGSLVNKDYLTPDESKTRHDVTATMLDCIAHQFSAEIACRINKIL